MVMLLATAIATTLRTIACVQYLDNRTGLFSEGSLITASNAIILITIFGMISYLFVATRISLRPSFSTSATYVPTGVVGVATAFLGIKSIFYALQINDYRLYAFRAESLREVIVELLTLQNIITSCALLAGILAFVSLAHHFLNAFITDGHSVLRAYFATATICFLAFYAMIVYLDNSVPVNDPNKALRQMSFLFASGFFLYETRISLGREMWRLYSVFGLIAATLTAYTSIPAIVTYFANGEIISSSGYQSLASLEEYILLFTLFVFIVLRLYLTVIIKEDKENSLVKALAQMASEQEKKISESAQRHKESFSSKQLSLFDLYSGTQENEEVEPDAEPIEEIEPEEEEEKEVMISDDAIYESIFGKMPERPAPEKEEVEEKAVDDRDPEVVADEFFNMISEIFKDDSDI